MLENTNFSSAISNFKTLMQLHRPPQSSEILFQFCETKKWEDNKLDLTKPQSQNHHGRRKNLIGEDHHSVVPNTTDSMLTSKARCTFMSPHARVGLKNMHELKPRSVKMDKKIVWLAYDFFEGKNYKEPEVESTSLNGWFYWAKNEIDFLKRKDYGILELSESCPMKGTPRKC